MNIRCKQGFLSFFISCNTNNRGHVKLMAPFYSLEKLRKIPGFEGAIIVDPYSGVKGNSVTYFSVGQRGNYMRATGLENLFVGGEKSGFVVGHT